ncbi:25 kDa ookinete surface antigen precursor [Plasmodium reichenowi]|uniref:25 kDa ookinete surface antigen n=1 Tax=Plasmodium reichenowi TaxID=5854 RepID=A0A2P9DFW5_PLARE|nr:25 kDa ookinete surface antigen precursor [Plasmodium reichenowi]
MNKLYSLFLFLFIQLSIKYYNAKVTVDTVCKKGFLIQMSGHLECKCENDLVLINEETCEEKVLKCDETTVNKPCGDFSKCIKIDGSPISYACKCNPGYDMVNNVCILNECKNVTCGNGKCILDTSNPVKTGVCSCNIGKVPNADDKNKCSKDGETKCSLKCLKENETCKAVDGIYKCDCKDGFIMDNESSTCTAFSVYNILNLSLIFVLFSVCFFIM